MSDKRCAMKRNDEPGDRRTVESVKRGIGEPVNRRVGETENRGTGEPQNRHAVAPFPRFSASPLLRFSASPVLRFPVSLRHLCCQSLAVTLIAAMILTTPGMTEIAEAASKNTGLQTFGQILGLVQAVVGQGFVRNPDGSVTGNYRPLAVGLNPTTPGASQVYNAYLENQVLYNPSIKLDANPGNM